MHQWLEQYGQSVLTIFLIALLFRLFRSKTTKLNLPPSPSRLPIIGNLHQLSSLPHRSLQSLARKHGPLMIVHFGKKPILVVSSADAAKEMMKTQDLIFCSRPSVSTAKQVNSNNSLAFSPYGEYWRQVRKVCVLQVLSPARVESYRSVRQEEVDVMINNIRQSSYSTQPVINLSKMIMSYTNNNVTCRVAFGRKFEGKFLDMISEFMYLTGTFNVGDYIPWLAWVNRCNGITARKAKNRKDLDCFYESVIEEHMQARRRDRGGGESVEDFVDVLLAIEKDCLLGVPFSKANIKSLILDMFIAGTDTSSATSVWAMTELVRHPEIVKEVQREIREIAKAKKCITEDDLGQMHYLKMVIKETLRLHAPVPLLLPRESMADTKLQGFDIPAKTRVIFNAWAVGRDPTSWEEPEEFRPKRFSNLPVEYRGQDFDSIPFGGGRRVCPGIIFATPNMELPLANLLYHFDWSLPDGAATWKDVDVAEGSGLIANKKSPLLLVSTPCRV